MKAVLATPQGLAVRDMPEPSPGPDEVLVRVRAAGLNRADLAAAVNADPAGRPIGMEWAGEVAAVGGAVTEVRPGDRVMCSGVGGYAEFALADRGRTIPLPDGLDFEAAAVLPIALLTMHDALVTNGRLVAGERVLIQGASSGVGILGLQIARHLGARQVIGSARQADRRARLAEFGADHAIDPADPAWPDQVLEATGGTGVDLVVDMVSGPAATLAMKATRVLGRIVNVGRLGGARAEFDFDLHALKRIDYRGVTFRTRSLQEVREIVRLMRADLWEAVAAGALRLPVDRAFPLDEVAAAHAHMRANAHFGKIVLKP